jgi:hypothetical protein
MLFFALACSSPPTTPDVETPTEPVELRVATFNTSLFRDAPGQLADELQDPDVQVRAIQAIIEEVQPDVVLLNEVDWDAGGLAVGRLADLLGYEFTVAPPVNTGVASGLDLNNDGEVVTSPGDGYAEDAWGFGQYEGQYGLAVLSRLPLGDPRTFQELTWASMPDAWWPEGWFSEEEQLAVRLSSKTHADVPVEVDGRVLHLWVSHPTPPVFDGAEDRNGRRNHDEVRFWSEYQTADWMVDDWGTAGGAQGSFVIMGDLNSDPDRGDSSGTTCASTTSCPRWTSR